MTEPEYPPDINAHLWRSSRHPSGRLRCGVLLDGRGQVEEWAQRVIELLSREPVLALESIYRLPAPDPSVPPSGSALFEWFHRWSSSSAAPLKRVELRAPACVSILVLGSGEEEIRPAIAVAQLDVLIWLESGALALDCHDLARFGVWQFCFGDPDEQRCYPPYWREVATASAVSTLALESNTGGGHVRRLAVAQMATQQGLHVTGNAIQPLALAGPLLLRNLLDVLEPEGSLGAEPTPAADVREPSWPGNFETAGLIARQASRSASLRLRSRGREAKWFVAVRNKRDLFRTRQNEFVPSGFRDVTSSAGSQFADPFVFDAHGRHWLFVEEIPAGTPKGRLAVMELDHDGVCGPPVTILELPYHLSYPFVFDDGGEFFMIPETSANNNIQLYRATRFPFEWKLEKVLYSNVRAVDTTPLFFGGIWYFFTTSARLGHETFLFWSTTLDGDWQYHPCNPICSDVRRSRGAGPLFYSDGALIRPAQDCSVRYGYAIALNRVRKISPTDYDEELIEVIYPKWRKGLLGTHTLGSNDSFEVIDGLRY